MNIPTYIFNTMRKNGVKKLSFSINEDAEGSLYEYIQANTDDGVIHASLFDRAYYPLLLEENGFDKEYCVVRGPSSYHNFL